MFRRLVKEGIRHFEKGGKWHRFYPLYEMVDTFVYWSRQVTLRAPHIRDALDMKRMMSYVVLATIPCVLMSWFNTGYQVNMAMAQGAMAQGNLGGVLNDWRGALTAMSGISHDPQSVFACVWLGFWYFLPIYLVTLLAGGFWEMLFAVVRRHEVNEGFFVTSILYTLTLPPDVPLWMVALGISFGVVIGKEVFGGTGKNFLNPALVGRAFLYFAYPASMSGDKIWVALDGYSGATPLAAAAQGGISNVIAIGYDWWDAFWGIIPGSLGETSALACLLGGAFLVYTRIASWRIIAGVFLGMVATVLVLNWVGSDSNPMFSMPWHWHLVVGGFCFGMVFMATEPVSAAHTNLGRWLYGLLIGFMAVMIRVLNPAFPEGIMLAILFANIFAPVIDYMVVKMNVRRREKHFSSTE